LGALGMELGTRRARAAWVGERGIRVAELPAVVSAYRGHPLVGVAAERRIARSGSPSWPLELLLGGPGLAIAGKRVSIESLAAVVAHQLVELTRKDLVSLPETAVLAMPPQLGRQGRDRWRTAVESVGVRVTATILEPSAIALAVASGHGHSGPVAVVDIGAGGAAVALYELTASRLKLLGCHAAEGAGGDAIDEALLELALGRLGAQAARVRADAAAVGALRRACEAMKRRIPAEHSVAQRVEAFPGEAALVFRLDRSDLTSALAPVRAAIEVGCLATMVECGMGPNAVASVYLHGGSAHLGELVTAVGTAFASTPVVVADQIPAVAYGAAALAGARHIEVDETVIMTAPRARDAAHSSAPGPDAAHSSAPGRGSRPGLHDSGDRTHTQSGMHKTSGQASRSGTHDSGERSRSSKPPAPSSRRLLLLERGGHIHNHADPALVLALPVQRPLTDADLDPIALPILLLRVLVGGTASGTLRVRPAGDGADVTLLVSRGRAHQNDQERAAFRQAFGWHDATYTFDSTEVDVGERPPTSMARVVADGLRFLWRRTLPETLAETLGERMAQAPLVREGRQPIVQHLQLDAREQRLIDTWLDGTATTGRIAYHGGIGLNTALALFVLLAFFDCLDWRPPVPRASKSLADVLEERAKAIEHAPLFAVLGLHWSAPEADIHRAYNDLRAELGVGTPAHKTAPEACARILKRARAAYEILKRPDLRAQHRRESAPALDFDAIDHLLAKRAEGLALKKDESGEAEAEKVRQELKRFRKPE
jgi:Hsp70 protein